VTQWYQVRPRVGRKTWSSWRILSTNESSAIEMAGEICTDWIRADK
jgi:hypothetical protein